MTADARPAHNFLAAAMALALPNHDPLLPEFTSMTE